MAKYTADSCSVKESGMSVAMAGLPGDAARIASLLNRAERMEKALEFVRDNLYAPDPNCSCHISPPCADCVDHSNTRVAIQIATEALSLEEQPT